MIIDRMRMAALGAVVAIAPAWPAAAQQAAEEAAREAVDPRATCLAMAEEYELFIEVYTDMTLGLFSLSDTLARTRADFDRRQVPVPPELVDAETTVDALIETIGIMAGTGDAMAAIVEPICP